MSEKYKIKVIVQNYPLHRYDLFKTNQLQVQNTDYFFKNGFLALLYLHVRRLDYMINSTINALQQIRKNLKIKKKYCMFNLL